MSTEKDSIRVLVVDDSATMRQLIKMMLLQHLRCQVDEAADGLEAMAKLAAGPFDLVITDINMPNMDGLKLISGIRETLHLPLPIIIITTRGAEKDREEGLRRGASAYVTKPVNSLGMINVVREVMR